MSRTRHTYPVALSAEHQRFLEGLLQTQATPAHHSKVARVLLLSDQSQGKASYTDEQIAQLLALSRRTVIRMRQHFCQGGLQRVLAGGYSREHPERRRLDGKGEAQLIALACSQAPAGHQRWTLRLLADQMVQLDYVEQISPETVRQTLKKMN
jgi:DNA-binding CsgD family transcriptional regulator